MATPSGFFFRFLENGAERRVRLYATTSDWNKEIIVSDDEKSVKMIGNQQLRFCDLEKKEYIYHSLLDRRVSWTCDLSKVKKSWNCALYTCDFRGLRVPDYLDAQSGNSVCEMDFLEGNRISYHYTAHRAGDRPGGMVMGLGGSVQGNGNQKFRCDQVQMKAEDLYKPGGYIDTNNPFRVSVEHTRERVRLQLQQDERVIYKEDGGAYLASIVDTLAEEKHTFIFSLWTGWMDWLDGSLPWYPDNHIDRVEATISDLVIEDLSHRQLPEEKKCCSCFCHQ